MTTVKSNRIVFDAPDGTYRVYNPDSGDFLVATLYKKIVTLMRISYYKLSDEKVAAFLARQGTPISGIPATPDARKSAPPMSDNFCPVCGVAWRGRPPYYKGYASYDICPCCDIQYGFEDHLLGETFESLRSKWIEAGADWKQGMKPEGWSAAQQLRNIGVEFA